MPDDAVLDTLKFGIGQPVLRTEDPKLLTGRGTYADDYSAEGQAYCAFLRSPIAHGNIAGIDISAAATADAAPAPLARQGTMKLRKAQKEAKGSEAMGEWLVDWEDVMREDKAQLKVRCGEWAARRGLNADMHTGFLDCSTGRDIVDCYELWVRLSHLIHRGAGIVQASETRCASEVGDRLFLGGALVANAGGCAARGAPAR